MKRISIAFLWHMHQPPYLDPFTGQYRLPWVVLHGLKDYFDMPALLEELDDTRISINLVPILMTQLRDYQSGIARDAYLDVATKAPELLSDRERRFIETFFFPFPDEIMGNFNPHFLHLKKKVRAARSTGEQGNALTHQELRDAQVLFMLFWAGRALRAEDLVSALMDKGRDFTAADLDGLMQLYRAFLPRILPEYRRQRDAGKLEVSVSPYSHPILPLLVDSHAAQVAKPGSPLPNERFSYPIDARLHLAIAQDRYTEVFGAPATGMWPSEGSVSPEVVPLVREAGVNWVCTDRAILEKALGRRVAFEETLRPYRFKGLHFFFRDTKISDLIGFTYASWKPREAVDDFLRRIRELAERSPMEHPVVTVAMDGENAWEYFTHGGYEFLRTLYRAIEDAPDLTTTTFGGYLEEHPETVEELGHIGTGSWIYGDFSTWIGDPIKNRAWEYLTYTRKEVENFLREHTDMSLDRLKHLPVVEFLLRAESSDWFWWYGEGHSSINDPDFDDLFRANLRFLYFLIGKPAPAYLDRPLVEERRDDTSTIPPFAYIRPCITGKQDDYFEWLSAGSYELQSGALHKLQPRLRKAYFGYDPDTFFLRVDTFDPALTALAKVELEVRFGQPCPYALRMSLVDGRWTLVEKLAREGGEARALELSVGRIVELAIPFDRLVPPDEIEAGLRHTVSFNLRLYKRGMEVERFPWNHDIDVQVNTIDLETENWFV